MLVLIQVSSMKTSLLGSRLASRAFQRLGRRAISGRACSRANRVFFIAQAFAPRELPHRIVRDADTARGQFLFQSVQGEVRRFLEPLLDEIAMGQQHRLAVAAHFAWGYRARRPVALHQLHNARDRNIKASRRLPGAGPALNRCNHALTQIVRKGTRRRCWPPPSQHLESLFAEKGNPLRFS
jgi:hypothetical protein